MGHMGTTSPTPVGYPDTPRGETAFTNVPTTDCDAMDRVFIIQGFMPPPPIPG